ncbi:GntR family transcriptional regulator [Streptomyces hygroscopicus]|uniref:GntR family transcriptional regulator n=1 Tax=Streptomyces hygroscopicus TaxID=1912 RepID=UPI003F4CC73C
MRDALGQDYGASRTTVRRALDMPRAERPVERQPGVGTAVVAGRRLGEAPRTAWTRRWPRRAPSRTWPRRTGAGGGEPSMYRRR